MEIETCQQLGDQLIIMMDANEDIQMAQIWKALAEKLILEAITNKYAGPVPPAFNEGKNPIDGIFLSIPLKIV